MPPDVTTMLIELVKEIKADITDIKEKQTEAAVSISVIKTMQEAIENLKIDDRLRHVETQMSQGKGGVGLVTWLVPTVLSVIGTGVAVMALVKH